MHDLILPRLYCLRTHCTTYMLPSSSAAYPIILHFFNPFSHLSATFLMLVSQLPRVSAAVYAVHPYPSYFSSSVSNSAVIVNLSLPFHSYLTPSTPYRIYAFDILIILHLCRASAFAFSIILRLCRFCSPFLCPRYVHY